ncbi:MAG: hypothetical protein K2Y09_13675 [Nitrosomonas sp.]|uniref:hypothetical protein n=1 Tax=Nitrosomonas sp. TaxID=42353 RepID=UPI001DC85E5C|nr:hypothetical protein [Nitrosomonas sp.]MBX9896198.1 hypothetical protein [Nitrosomonas sp.]
MKFERLITIITNLAVVAGMVLVVLELQQNREAIQIAHQLSLAGLMSQAHLAVASDQELADLVTRAKRNDTQDFSPVDTERVNHWVLAFLEPRISSYHLRSNEFIVLEDWCNLMRDFTDLYRHPYFGVIVKSDLSYADAIAADIENRCTMNP